MKSGDIWASNSGESGGVAPLLLRKSQAAKALAVSERTIDYWRKCGKLPAVVIGSHPRFDIEDLKRLIAEQKESSPSVASA